ncbi:MAG: hypothetical protein MPEBLZ_00115 [Candidatus Methanoperedens nitroreducens]|uniref:Uncharacterized protein n=1 Tax=Candidatus Methanoperedens nitratireducens TaxID=1392998 RepID=A0A0N8KRL0_9EURY|nr:hypothetical protein [Candidatus Methanoperedens sp. BLZ2]KAB2946258.1 MAG: hypothetical protein F9K14_07970 [Candidatus Methanoperedens sp.]KPQ45234.1 MAG: hypothetical protein MPEBLZ_00115 [Candidatus Methanoperedens sp. BLZ1]MBZ0176009.1 hypothetical protein [Candidatus Methanoperedens nitroreducens]MCX9076737.1 hypothetical protein [Candidatus Methanoperedens sp.]MCX9087574.1 hypothetical protein [Candidatus Methanoperedens sp.]
MIPAKVISIGIEIASRVLETHLFKYLESKTNNVIKTETIREITARASKLAFKGKDVCIFDTAIIIPIYI